jgi:hypothetical protein
MAKLLNQTKPILELQSKKKPLDYHDDIGIKMEIDVIIT